VLVETEIPIKLILASASSRRAEILRDAGYVFEVIPPRVDESRRDQETPEAYVCRLAEEKARAASKGLDGPVTLIGADTVVVLAGEMLSKPQSADDARRMLRELSGQTHEVLTGLAVLRVPADERRKGPRRTEQVRVVSESTRVTFATLSKGEIDEYIASGEAFDKAGAYAIQGRAGRFVTRIEGGYFNVVGLPLARLYQLLQELDTRPS
jgi:septum formation protein